MWIQRAGRAGRSKDLAAHAVLCVEASVLQPVRSSARAEVDPTENGLEGDEREKIVDGEITYRKKIEPMLRRYVETQACRRDVADELFNNPPRSAGT